MLMMDEHQEGHLACSKTTPSISISFQLSHET